MRSKLALAAGALLLVCAGARAEVVTFEFEGTVAYSTAMAPVGTPVSGRFSWDTDAPPSAGLPGYQYSSYGPPYTFGISATVGAHTFASNELQVSVFNDMGANTEDMIDMTGVRVAVDGTTFANGYFAIRLASGPGKTQVFRDTSLPSHLELPVFDAANMNAAQLYDGSYPGLLLDIKLTQVRRAAPH